MKTNFIILALFIISFLSCTTSKNDIPLPEHPRPNFERPVWQNLNGHWNFKPDSLNLGISENWQNRPESFEHKILVPFSWASPASQITMPHINIGWYSRSFQLENPAKWTQNNIYLNFCASDFNTAVWINGEEAGKHSGGYTPFDFNITNLLKEGENTIVVRVEDEELKNRPSGKQYYGNAKGIWQTVYLESRSSNHVSLIHFTPDIDNEEVTVKVQFARELVKQATIELKGKNNNIRFKKEISPKTSIARFTIPIANMELWDLDDPFLYEVSATISGDEINDEISTYFGMRKISAVEIPGKDFQYVALNNKPLYLKMALDQSYHPEGFYTFPSDDFMKEEIQRAKDIGLNGLRIHIKAEIPRKLYWADKLGLLIQEDIPNFWGEPDNTAKENWEQVAENEIERDYNHPSIFSWVLFNETWGLFSRDSSGRRSYTEETQDWVREWYHKTKLMDPTRLVEDNSPCNWDHVITDINTWHKYAPARHWADFLDEIVENTYPGSDHNYIGGNKQGNEPMFNSECGAVWGYAGSTGDIDITWEYHIMMNEFRKRPKIAGFLFTEFHDVINEWNGYYRFDRSKKIFGLDEIHTGMSLIDFHKDLYVVAGTDFFQTYSGGASINIPIGVSAITSSIPQNLKISYSVYGWNELGDRIEHNKGEINAQASPFSFTENDPIKITLPKHDMLMVLATELKDEKGKVLQRNFVPFQVDGASQNEQLTVTRSPSDFKDASWSVKYFAPQDGNKVWGMGSGFFEYEFDLPEEIDPEQVESIEFRAELASRYPQSKYLEDGEAERIGMTIVSEKGTDNGYGKNSYPQTDEKLHGSIVKITANNQKIAEVELSDDPADHTGLLSWMNQKPGWEWGDSDRSNRWFLDEAGSYGYMVRADLDITALKSTFENGTVVVRLHVDESTNNRGGLSVYGKKSGRFPMDLTLLIRKK